MDHNRIIHKRMKTEGDQRNSFLKTALEFLQTTRKKLKVGISKFWKDFKHAVDQFMNLLFNTTKFGGEVRRWLFIVISALIWAVAAYINHPPAIGEDFFADFINYPFEALFHPRILRHVLISGLSFWLAIQIAASYLDDVFELGDPKIAESYILKASLANRYQQIEVKEGKISGNKESTIVRIGGPGLVRVHYDSAVLFEKFNGEPTVLTSDDGLIALDRFERLRKTVLLRDHIDETPIEVHTRDGITVGANGVRIKYFVHRNETNPNKIEVDKKSKIPYPVVRSAVKKLVYDEKITKLINPISIKTEEKDTLPDIPHPEALEITSYPIREKFRNFISQRTLGEFLATISDVEYQKRKEETEELETGAMHLTGEMPIESKAEEEKDKASIKGNFFSRNEITKMMYEGNDQQEKLKTGIELDWIDIGTWILPPNAQKIFEQHLEAWELSLDNITNRSSKAENDIKAESKIKALQKFLNDLILEFETHRYSSNKSESIHLLLNLYYQTLLEAQGIFRKHPDHKAAPLPLSRVINHLSKLLGRRRDPGRP